MSITLSLDLNVHYGFVDLVPADELIDDLIAARGGQANGLWGEIPRRAGNDHRVAHRNRSVRSGGVGGRAGHR
jgi:hypothetical protein